MKLPYGISNFARLIEDGYHYVDKTGYIEQLENEPAPYLFFLRPRRFGKSLFISMLSYYYGLEHQERFDSLFGKFYIGTNPTPRANTYAVLKFEFSRIDTSTPEHTQQGFHANVLLGIENFEKRYQQTFMDYSAFDNPAEALKRFFETHRDKKIYLLIDEYDHFANEILSFHFEHFSDIISRNGFVRKFYETIKAATGKGIVDRLFMTGVTPITLDSLTSGFNIAQNCSTWEEYNEMMGFTEDNVAQLLQPLCRECQIEKKLVLENLRRWYNGYQFHSEGEERVYNPDMVLYFATQLTPRRKCKYPEKLIDINIASDYGKIRRLFQLKDPHQNYQVIDQLIHDGFVTSQLTEQFSFERDFTQQDFISLLFYMGFISIKEAQFNNLHFVIPNFVIKGLYWEFFLQWVKEQNTLTFEVADVRQAMLDLAENNQLQPFLNLIEGSLQTLSNRDFIQFDEKYVKVLFVAFASLANLYYIQSEQESEQKYVDVLLLHRPPYFPNYQFAFELKYLKKSESAQLETTVQKAIAQLQGYLQSEALQRLDNLKAYVIVFVGSEAKAVETMEL
jgi:hypothetical protein